MNQHNKQFVWNYWQAMENGGDAHTVSRYLYPDVIWHGFQPLRYLTGAAEVWTQFWQPLLAAMPDLVRRPYLFIGGQFEGGDWVCGTGDFIGTFANDWQVGNITIPASGSSVHFRFGEFCKVADGKIVEIRLIIDLIDLLRQVGIQLLPPNYGRDIWIPGPLSGDGLCFTQQDEYESQKTYALVTEMIFGGLNKYDGKNQASQELERYWQPHMVWHGPVGIGSAYGLAEFKKNAQGPIVRAFPDRIGVGHQARIAEGLFAASTGWPSLGGTHLNLYLDWPPTGEYIGWNIMDFWRREGDKLQENWVMIDLIDAALASGVDLLSRLSVKTSS
ncbi:ester cyclase [Candidatus Leptofilum sp.]|uniref:nuclear transport factor 2 family protein n=1 Tax=Candidatus Leptofilum sp. TaxID=3241576 RepID=UPI003B591248